MLVELHRKSTIAPHGDERMSNELETHSIPISHFVNC